MTSSDERREVAEQLRALPSDIYPTIKEWEKDGLFIGATLCDEADYSQIHNAVFGCFPPEYIHPGDREELHERLADLIDPTCKIDSVEPIEYGEFNQTIGYDFNLTCGHSVMRPYMDMPPAYCDECGARVVDDE